MIQVISQILSSRRFSLSNEKRLQEEIAEALALAGVQLVREFRLDAGSIIDFMVGDVGIEVKIKGSKLSIFRQVERYAGFDQIRQLLLVTNVPMGMPAEINGKPVFVFNLAKAWL